MRIAIVSDTIGSTISNVEKGFISGAVISSIRFIREFAKNHELVILTSKPRGFPEFEKNGKFRIYRFSGIPIPKTKHEAYISIPLLSKVLLILKKEKVEIVHIQEPTLLALNCTIACKILKIPIVSSAHTQGGNVLSYLIKLEESGNTFKILNKLINKSVIGLANLADVVIAPSNFAKDYLVKRGLRKRIIVISNGVDTKTFSPRNTNKKKELKLNKEKIILYVGRLSYEKNIVTLIKSLKILVKNDKNIRLIIVGGGPQEKILKNIAKKMKVDKFIYFVGKVSDSDLPKYYATADLFVLPSLVELQGMVVLEAMATGLPVIVSNYKESAAGELINNNGFIFKAKDPRDLAGKIKKIFENPGLRKRFCKNSLKIAREHNFNKSVTEIEKVYRQLTKQI